MHKNERKRDSISDMNDNKTLLWGFVPRYISWVTIVLGLMTLGTFFAVASPDRGYYPIMPMSRWVESTVGSSPPMGAPVMTTGVSSAPAEMGMTRDLYYPYPYPNPDVPVTDTREFLKTYYNASMRTRDVSSTVRRVETTVRGHGGRIDQMSAALKYGSVSFSISQNKFEAFRTELESFVNERFLTVNISSQNMLPQKVSIEEQQKQADKTLADYKVARQKLVAAHASTVRVLEAKIASEKDSLVLAELTKELANENASYQSQLRTADDAIKYAEEWQKAVVTQDKALLENVGTVNGTVSLEWISLWDIALVYLPGYWIPTIFALLTLISFARDRRRSRVATI